jgi:hypothetical protein
MTAYPAGWNEARIRGVLEYYENQSEDDAVAEDEALTIIEGEQAQADAHVSVG